MKTCTKCKQSFIIEQFARDKYTKDGYYPSCKACVNLKPSKVDRVKKAAYDKEYRKTLGFRKAANQYKVPASFLENLMREQGNKCAICKSPPKKQRLSIDHCHATGKVRGLLCSPCNLALGLFRDNKDFLLESIEYLERSKDNP